MSDAGNVNGDVIDDPLVNSKVVGVDYSPEGGTGGTSDVKPSPTGGQFDPGDHTVAEVEDYLAANPGDADRVVAAEKAGKGRVSIVGED